MAKLPPFPKPDDKPVEQRSLWEKIIISTPVVLTVVATVLAGLSNSELTNAQYVRALAAQVQSKISDQWSYFQAKKIRAEQDQNTAQILQSVIQPVTFDVTSLRAAGQRLVDEMNQALSSAQSPDAARHLARVESLLKNINQAATEPDLADALSRFGKGEMPKIQEQPIDDPQISDTIRGVDSHASDADLEQQAGKIPQENINKAIAVANANIAAFGDALDHANKSTSDFEKLGHELSDEIVAFEGSLPPGSSGALVRDLASQLTGAFTVARLNYDAHRYSAEARYNQTLAEVYEVQVRRNGFESDRHRDRSRRFFYGMLAAQAGVTIATFALAVRKRSVLWGMAASAGLAAITFAAYVYLFV